MKIRFSTGGEETGIVNQSFARALSVLTGFRMRSFEDEAQASAFLRSFLDSPSSSGEKDKEWVQQLAQRLVSGKLAVVSRTRSAPAFIHPRPIEVSPLQDEEALRQRDPEPVPPPPPVTLVEPMVVTPEQLRTDAPLCELWNQPPASGSEAPPEPPWPPPREESPSEDPMVFAPLAESNALHAASESGTLFSDTWQPRG